MRRRGPVRSAPTAARRLASAWIGLLCLAVPPTPGVAQEDWCDDADYGDRDRPGHCEVRELRLDAVGALDLDASPNGGISVRASDRDEVRILARVVARAETAERAREIASGVEVEVDRDRVHASGPRTGRREHWSVSYRVSVPESYDLDLHSTNGGVSVEGVSGRMELRTTNGGIRLERVAGDVGGRTTNGGIHVELAGDRWDGAGLDVETTNGGVTLEVPEGYAADLEAGTTNGGFSVDFPITVQGRLGRTIETELGGGGAPIRVMTTNGGVRIRKASG